MIELTPEQRQALTVQNGEPVRVVDSTTHRAYFLLPAEDYYRLIGYVPSPEEVASGIPPQMLRSQQAFWRDLPQLLKGWRTRGKWVAYHGDERVGIGKSKTDLCQLCLGRGLQRGDFYVGKIEEHETAPWVPTPMEESLFECTDDLSPPPAAP